MSVWKETVGQQPNIELEISDLPRPRPKPAPARVWEPHRPGEVTGPGQERWGDGFGTSGPDAGYAFHLVKGQELILADTEHRAAAETVVAALAAARASHFGRGPTRGDIEVAALILGYLPDGIPADMVSRLREARRRWVAAAGHSQGRLTGLVAAVDPVALVSTLGEVRTTLAAGETPIEV